MDSENISKIMSLKKLLEEEKSDDRILRALKLLNDCNMTVDLLQKTGIGKAVNLYRKKDGQIGPFAKSLVIKWKQDVAKFMADSSESSGSKRPSSPDVEKEAKRPRLDGELVSDKIREPSRAESSSKVNSDKHRHSGRGDHRSRDRHLESRDRADRTSSDGSRDKSRRSHSDSRHGDGGRDKSDNRESSNSTRHNDADKKHDRSREASNHNASNEAARHSSSRSKSGADRRSVDDRKKSDFIRDEISKSRREESAREKNSTGSRDKATKDSTDETSSSPRNSDDKLNRRKSTSPRKSTLPQFHVPAPQPVGLQESEILSSLPQTITNYKPLPHIDLNNLGRRRATDEEIGTKKHSRSAVYSGRKTKSLTQVPRLLDACMEVLMDNIDSIDYVGGAPYFLLKPLLSKCTPEQLYNLEHYNPHLIDDTVELWKDHCTREFRGRQRDEDECESWRELFLRLHDERERKLKKLTANISAQHTALKDAGRKIKLAFVESVVKPPRDVLRKQKLHGTGGHVRAAVDPLEKLSSRGTEPKNTGARTSDTKHSNTDPVPLGKPNLLPASSSSRPTTKKPATAPLMARTMRMMKNMRR